MKQVNDGLTFLDLNKLLVYSKETLEIKIIIILVLLGRSIINYGFLLTIFQKENDRVWELVFKQSTHQFFSDKMKFFK